jgi:hypothetical protein
MSVLIEASPRNAFPSWTLEAVDSGRARGAVIAPFELPPIDVPFHKGADAMAIALHDVGAEVWFDAMTHGLQMPNVGDFRFYDDYDLWSGAPGDLWTAADQERHVRRVFAVQDRLGAPHLGPAILLHHPAAETSQSALELSHTAMELDGRCWLSIAGTSACWSSAPSALDAHIGALAQLEPAGWFLTVARPVSALPGDASQEEIYGLCRTVRALSEYAPVYISHGDLAALPAVAAGATSLGTGWDPRQRACGFNSYGARDTATDGGSWYARPTLRGLLGSLKPNEAAILNSQDPALAHRLGPLPAPGAHEAFTQHLEILNELVSTLTALDIVGAYRWLMDAYQNAQGEWPGVVTLTGTPQGAESWIAPFQAGLGRYGTDEGW